MEAHPPPPPPPPPPPLPPPPHPEPHYFAFCAKKSDKNPIFSVLGLKAHLIGLG